MTDQRAEAVRRPASRSSNRNKWIFTITALAAVPVFMLASSYYDYRSSAKEFLARHAEATTAINTIFADYARDGHWPDQAKWNEVVKQSLPAGWQGDADPAHGGPLIWLSGPSRLTLIYFFRPPKEGVIGRTWFVRADKQMHPFQTAVEYMAK